jgi:hypothetical protein
MGMEEQIKEKTWEMCKKYDAHGFAHNRIRLNNYVSVWLATHFNIEIENLYRNEWQQETTLFCQKYGYTL